MGVAISTQPTDRTVLQGSTATFTATATTIPFGGTMTATWHRVVGASDTIVQGPTATFGSSTFTTGATGPPNPDIDKNKYYAVFANTSVGGGTATTNRASLTIATPVKIEVPPTDTAAPDGSTVLLFTQASGNDLPFTYQWYKDNVAISGATDNTYSFTMTSALAGVYKVVVTGALGSSDNASCNVVFDNGGGGGGGGGGGSGAPTLTSGLTSHTVKVGASSTFTVIASGGDALTYAWTKDGVDIAGATSSSYTIQSAKLTDAGSYTVVVSNSFGSVSSTAALVVTKSSSALIWVIIGIVVAILLLIALITTIILLSNRKKKKLEMEIQKKQVAEQKLATPTTTVPPRTLPVRR